MIGYLKPDFNDVPKEQKNEYKSFYCGLCKALKKNFGYNGILNLNYEITAFLILIKGLETEKCKTYRGSCTISPFVPVSYVDYYQDELICAAILAVIIAHYEIIDNLADEDKVKWKIINKMMAKTCNKAAASMGKRFVDIDNAVSNYYKIEKDCHAKFEDALEQEGNLIESFLSVLINDYDLETTNLLLKLTNLLGQWIFLIDACDDISEDILQNNFNPILLLENQKDVHKTIETIETKIANIVHSLPIKCYKQLVEFIFIDNLKKTSFKYSKNKNIS